MPTSTEADTLLALRWNIAAALRQALATGEPQAEHIAEAVVEALQATFGGNELYIPATPKSRRYAEIRRLATGNNRREVCHALNISPTTYYRALKTKP